MTGSQLKSWVASANDPHTDFPIQNLPFGVFQRASGGQPSIGVAIGNRILDLRACERQGLLESLPYSVAEACTSHALNALMATGREPCSALRTRLTDLLQDEADAHVMSIEPLLVPMEDAVMLLPADIGDYTDFYASIYHATNVGRLFRPDNPLLPNYKYVPIGYHGRASSIVLDGTPVRRPHGQSKEATSEHAVFGPSKSLDYELEIGLFVGEGNPLGEPIPLEEAEAHIFGLCLVNDWSARDIQAWEYQPLGPFLAKSFATTISPWVVTLDALEPFRTPAFKRPEKDPEILPYLRSPLDREKGGVDVTLEVYLSSAKMRAANIAPVRLSRGNFSDLYWTIAQLVTHHTSNGCNLRSGDLLASGAVSGVEADSLGCLLELTRRGADPIHLPGGEVRKFLEDGDEVIFRGYCEREGFPRIGFGECRGLVT